MKKFFLGLSEDGKYSSVTYLGSDEYPQLTIDAKEESGELTEEQQDMSVSDLYTAMRNAAKVTNGIE